MKTFMKFIVTLLVVAIVGYIVYYVSINGAKNNNVDLSGDFKSGDIGNLNSGEFESKNSGEISGEVIIDNSGDELDVTALKINKINEQATILYSGEIINTVSEKLSKDLIDDNAKDFLKYFNENELPSTIFVRDRVIEIIPNSDFLKNMVYYYDENGNLILYESVSNTVGGSSKYYFEKNNNIEISHNYDEPSITVEDENIFEILLRAQKLYNKFLK